MEHRSSLKSVDSLADSISQKQFEQAISDKQPDAWKQNQKELRRLRGQYPLYQWLMKLSSPEIRNTEGAGIGLNPFIVALCTGGGPDFTPVFKEGTENYTLAKQLANKLIRKYNTPLVEALKPEF